MKNDEKFNLTVFYCINAGDETAFVNSPGVESFDVRFVKMACSSMVKDIFLLKAFESGADAVLVLVCPKGSCRYVEGNLRAEKRVGWVRNLLDEIGIGGDRLILQNVSGDNPGSLEQLIETVKETLSTLGSSPAK